ncbi:hypothetical protein BDY24DRAFT_369394 [Mrakia frigida]|uniref:uncharacterized protein n=1 Tax=Mrakia frigida TaxID=29902 RepID=UPI003FCC0D30
MLLRTALLSSPFIALLLARLWRSPLQPSFPPHPSAAFDGIYTRVLSPHGSLVLIICHVRGASVRPSMVHVSWNPFPPPSSSSSSSSSSSPQRWDVDLFPPPLETILQPLSLDSQQGFTLTAPGVGSLVSEPSKDGGTTTHSLEFELNSKRKKLVLTTSNRVPWTEGVPNGGPEGWIAHLKGLLPLHWLVQSSGSEAKWRVVNASLDDDEKESEGQDREGRVRSGFEGKGIAHIEKNWGTTFPPSWIWLQALSPVSSSFSPSPLPSSAFSFALAGGLLPPPLPSLPFLTLPMEAYLFGLRIPSLNIAWDFRPPFTLRFLGWSPWLKVERFASEGRVRIEAVEGWGRRKVLVESQADPPTFIPLSCPLSTGHSLTSERFALESFSSLTRIQAFTRRWPVVGEWEQVWMGETDRGGLEFGGSWGEDLV